MLARGSFAICSRLRLRWLRGVFVICSLCKVEICALQSSTGQEGRDLGFVANSSSRAFLSALGHVTLVDPQTGEEQERLHTDGINGRKDLRIADEQRGECDSTPYFTDTAPDRDEQPKSFIWRLRLAQPCMQFSKFRTEWEVYSVAFYRDACATARDQVKPIQTLSSGDSSVRFNKQLAFDADPRSGWRGSEDPDGLIWMQVKFNASETVRCVKFVQCSCLRSARAAVLEYDKHCDGQFELVAAKPNVVWGEVSVLDVDQIVKHEAHGIFKNVKPKIKWPGQGH